MACQYKDKVMHIQRPKVFLWSVSLTAASRKCQREVGHPGQCTAWAVHHSLRGHHGDPTASLAWHHALNRGDSLCQEEQSGDSQGQCWSALSHQQRTFPWGLSKCNRSLLCGLWDCATQSTCINLFLCGFHCLDGWHEAQQGYGPEGTLWVLLSEVWSDLATFAQISQYLLSRQIIS